MAQSLKHKIRKLAEQFNISAIISTAQEVQVDITDEAAWNALPAEQKTAWFEAQCAKYNLTITNHSLATDRNSYINRITVNEFKHKYSSQHPYFTVFLPHHTAWRGVGDDAWHLEIGSAYASAEHGEIWPTHPGLKGKEKQIAEVMRLRKELNI